MDFYENDNEQFTIGSLQLTARYEQLTGLNN